MGTAHYCLVWQPLAVPLGVSMGLRLCIPASSHLTGCPLEHHTLPASDWLLFQNRSEEYFREALRIAPEEGAGQSGTSLPGLPAAHFTPFFVFFFSFFSFLAETFM